MDSDSDHEHKNDDETPPPLFVRTNTVARSFGELYSADFKRQITSRYLNVLAVDSSDETVAAKHKAIVRYYHDNYYGQNELFDTPFGLRPVLYCDWTASGKNLQCVETFIQKEVLSLYANTHTSTSITGIQTSKFRSEARSIILQSLHGDVNKDVVVFCGSGVTGAIYKIANVLMKSPQYEAKSTVVFISVYEHNSNIFIWKELGIKVIVIPENEDQSKGHIDVAKLESFLKEYSSPKMKQTYNLVIGSFSAASNVSGIIAPIDDITQLLHKYGALSFWDFATAGPYLDINMTNEQNPLLSKDAVFISTHKFLSGVNSPGILCAKRSLFANYVPVIPGGGTVFFAYGVKDGEWEYLDNIEEKEEGGTPDIVGSIRASFAFMIKDHLSTKFIEHREKELLDYFLTETRCLENLQIMGNTQCERLPILSFQIWHQSSIDNKRKYLHHNYVAALLNDMFGIQGRGGCSCAGMYGIEVLAVTEKQMQHTLDQIRVRNELARIGYYRINLHYTLTEAEVQYIVEAVKFVAENGWKFLPLYDVDVSEGVYFHRDLNRKQQLSQDERLRSLLDISFDDKDGSMSWKEKHKRIDGVSLQNNLKGYIQMAQHAMRNLADRLPQSVEEFDAEKEVNDSEPWYWLPSEVYQEVLNLNNEFVD